MLILRSRKKSDIITGIPIKINGINISVDFTFLFCLATVVILKVIKIIFVFFWLIKIDKIAKKIEAQKRRLDWLNKR